MYIYWYLTVFLTSWCSKLGNLIFYFVYLVRCLEVVLEGMNNTLTIFRSLGVVDGKTILVMKWNGWMANQVKSLVRQNTWFIVIHLIFNLHPLSWPSKPKITQSPLNRRSYTHFYLAITRWAIPPQTLTTQSVIPTLWSRKRE